MEEWNLVKTEEMVTETAEVECLTPLVAQEMEEAECLVPLAGQERVEERIAATLFRVEQRLRLLKQVRKDRRVVLLLGRRIQAQVTRSCQDELPEQADLDRVGEDNSISVALLRPSWRPFLPRCRIGDSSYGTRLC